MNRVIEGKTILLNTFTNCTFIASALDEEVQTGSRVNDKHIEWAGELDVKVIVDTYTPKKELYNNLNYGGGFTEEDILKSIKPKIDTIEEKFNKFYNLAVAEDEQSEYIYLNEKIKRTDLEFLKEKSSSRYNELLNIIQDCIEKVNKEIPFGKSDAYDIIINYIKQIQ